MRKLKYILATLLISITIANGQQPQPQKQDQQHCIGYKAKVASPYSGYESSKHLQTAIEQIIAHNSSSEHAVSQSFVLIGNVEVIDTHTTDNLVRNTTTVYADFILEAVNLVDNNIYAITSVKIQSKDYSKAKAIEKLVQGIQISDPAYTKFIEHANNKIINYYDKNMVVFMKKAQTLMTLGENNEALKILQSIPKCVPTYDQSAVAINSLIDTLKDRQLKAD